MIPALSPLRFIARALRRLRPTQPLPARMNSSASRFATPPRAFRALRLFPLALAWVLGVFATAPLSAQAPLQNALFTAGTSVEDSQGDTWAFLLFQLTADVETLSGRGLAIYQKPGPIDGPGLFVKSGNVALQENPAVIKVLLQRAAALGQAPGDLDIVINELFGELIPSPTLPVEEKLSAVIRGSLADPRQFANLMLLARMHPGVSLSLGLAHTQRIPAGVTTFEVREVDSVGLEVGVVGRVAVDAGQPIVLTAPFAPVAVPETSPLGHLNARLRWGVPDDLRRTSLLQYGYNVYRVNKDYAEENGWHNTPPDQGLLSEAALDADKVRLVNRAPVLPTAIFNQIQALDLAADAKTFFLADDNGLASENPVPFRDGQTFYYFVAARDILGRDGLTSPGTAVTILDRVPPNAPRRPDVSNLTTFVGNEERFRLQVRWRQLTPTPLEPISGYYIYRWATPADVQKYAINPVFNRISPFIPHVPGQTHLTYVDDGDGAPTAPQALGKTFWYSVRAVKATAGGGNLSPNSAPAFGVLRNRFAPAAPSGQIFITCCLPDVTPDRFEDLADPDAADPLRAIFDLVATRDSRTVAWAEFALNDTRDPAQFLGRFHFPFFRKQVRHRLDLGRALIEGDATVVYCRVGDSGGKVSDWVELSARGAAPVGSVRRFLFAATELCQEVELTEASVAAGCDTHSPGGLKFPDGLTTPQDGENPSNPIKLKFPLTERTKEYRVYRRVDEGDLTLWRQGLADEAEANEIVLEDGALPPNAGEVSFFGQFLDDNGNASELVLIGQHVAVAQPAPRPMLSPPEIAGNNAQPAMKLQWFSPPHGVERFAVLLAVEPGPVPFFLSDLLSTNTEAPQAKVNIAPNENIPPKNLVFGAYLTPSVAGGFGPGPQYEVTIPVQKGRVYQVQIRAIARSKGTDSESTAYSFQWPTEDIDEATGPMVPWPARPLPEVSPAFNPELVPVRVQQPQFNGLGVVIGHIPQDKMNANGSLIGANADIRSFLFPSTADQGVSALLPLMLYRYQVASEAHPNPSRDLIQVTPLMQTIATAPSGGNRLLRDPFIALVGPDPSQGGPDDPWRIILLDTQPAVRKSAYAYVLVRFTKEGEIASVHPVPSILVP